MGYLVVRLLVNTDSQWSRVVNIDKTHVANPKLKGGMKGIYAAQGFL